MPWDGIACALYMLGKVKLYIVACSYTEASVNYACIPTVAMPYDQYHQGRCCMMIIGWQGMVSYWAAPFSMTSVWRCITTYQGPM